MSRVCSTCSHALRDVQAPSAGRGRTSADQLRALTAKDQSAGGGCAQSLLEMEFEEGVLRVLRWGYRRQALTSCASAARSR